MEITIEMLRVLFEENAKILTLPEGCVIVRQKIHGVIFPIVRVKSGLRRELWKTISMK